MADRGRSARPVRIVAAGWPRGIGGAPRRLTAADPPPGTASGPTCGDRGPPRSGRSARPCGSCWPVCSPNRPSPRCRSTSPAARLLPVHRPLHQRHVALLDLGQPEITVGSTLLTRSRRPDRVPAGPAQPARQTLRDRRAHVHLHRAGDRPAHPAAVHLQRPQPQRLGHRADHRPRRILAAADDLVAARTSWQIFAAGAGGLRRGCGG